MYWQPAFQSFPAGGGVPGIESSLAEVTACSCRAQGRDALAHCIHQFEDDVMRKGPDHYPSLITLAHLYLLYGDGYVNDPSDQGAYFQKSLQYCQEAMRTNPLFEQAISDGRSPWEASGLLTVDEIDAMVFWATGVFYYYKECLGPVGQMINYPWIRRAQTMLKAAEKLDPDWGGGMIYLSWGLYYLSLPDAVGGDKVKSARYFNKAIETGPEWLIHRWARGKYFHVKMQNKAAFAGDLQWVLDQDIETARDHMAWKRFFKSDARQLLDRKDELFD